MYKTFCPKELKSEGQLKFPFLRRVAHFLYKHASPTLLKKYIEQKGLDVHSED